jgi:hypothetical protein
MEQGRRLIALVAVGVMAIVIVAVVVSRRGAGPSAFEGSPVLPAATAPAESKQPDVELEAPTEARTPEPQLQEVPTPPPTPAEELAVPYDEKAWQEEMSKKPLEELIAASERISADFQEKAQPEFQRRFDAGIHEYMGAEQKFSGKDPSGEDIDASLVYSVYMPVGGGTYLVTLPEAEYPELYRLRAQSQWLVKNVHERSRGKN